jgi:hypothetical protein
MKTSNKIFISFLIFLFSGIIALYIGSKYYGNYNNPTNFVDKKTMLSPFSVVVAEEDADFYLNSGKENSITHSHLKGTLPNTDFFQVRNDTLFISSVKLKKGQVVLPLISCVKVKSIITKENSFVRMEKFQADTLNITMKKSQLDWRFDKVAFVSLQAKDSDIYLEGEKLEKLVVKLDKTKLNAPIKKRVENLSGSLKNTSDCTFYLSNKIILDVDKTSTYNFYNF